jgi:hypothetical protein
LGYERFSISTTAHTSKNHHPKINIPSDSVVVPLLIAGDQLLAVEFNLTPRATIEVPELIYTSQ